MQRSDFDREDFLGGPDLSKDMGLPSLQPDAVVEAGGPAARLRVIGVHTASHANVTLWADVPAAWAAATLTVYAVVGSLRAPVAQIVLAALPTGPQVLANFVGGVGGASTVEVDVQGIPPFVPAVPVPPLRLVLSSWDA